MTTVRVRARFDIDEHGPNVQVQFDAPWDGTPDGLAKILEVIRTTVTRADTEHRRQGGHGVKLAEPIRIDPVEEEVQEEQE